MDATKWPVRGRRVFAFTNCVCLILGTFVLAGCVNSTTTSDNRNPSTNGGKSPVTARSNTSSDSTPSKSTNLDSKSNDAKEPAKPTAEVSGTALVDGQPIREGSITFTLIGEKSLTWSTRIKDGKYELKAVQPGKMKVTVSIPRVAGKKKANDGPDSPLMDIVVEGLPARFNVKTELTAEVKAGKNIFDWQLLSR
jgi:hypothetical protein